MILHDAAGIMTALGWNLKLLEDRFVAGDELLETAQESIDELMLHCKEISELHVEESRGLTVTPQVSDLETWFQEAVNYTKSVAARAGIEVQSQFEMIDPLFATDTHFLHRMIRSLCRNALESCERGHTITLRAHQSFEGEFCLSVEHDGSSISLDEQQRMFDPYFSRRSTAPRNTGLELAFCRLATRALGGSIEYSRGEINGGRMLVKLPQIQIAQH
jgi:signal transduction histidine kinase